MGSDDERLRFARLSALEWRILLGVVDYHHRALDSGRFSTEAKRVAWSRAVSRLVARGIVTRERERGFLGYMRPNVRLAVDENVLAEAAQLAQWRARDRRNDDEDASMIDYYTWSIRRALSRRVRRAKPARPPAAHQLGAVAAALKVLETAPVTLAPVDAVFAMIGTMPGYTRDLIAVCIDEVNARKK